VPHRLGVGLLVEPVVRGVVKSPLRCERSIRIVIWSPLGTPSTHFDAGSS
jgi:hypothetical protein